MKSPKLDAALIEALRAKMADEGLGFSRAVDELGVNRATAHRWRRFGQKRIRACEDDDTSTLGLKAQWELVASRCQSAPVAKAERLIFDALSTGTPVCSVCNKDVLSEKDKLHNARWVASKRARDDYGDKVAVDINHHMEEKHEAYKPHMSAPAFAEMIYAAAVVAGMDPGAAEGDECEDEDPLPLH